MSKELVTQSLLAVKMAIELDSMEPIDRNESKSSYSGGYVHCKKVADAAIDAEIEKANRLKPTVLLHEILDSFDRVRDDIETSRGDARTEYNAGSDGCARMVLARIKIETERLQGSVKHTCEPVPTYPSPRLPADQEATNHKSGQDSKGEPFELMQVREHQFSSVPRRSTLPYPFKRHHLDEAFKAEAPRTMVDPACPACRDIEHLHALGIAHGANCPECGCQPSVTAAEPLESDADFRARILIEERRTWPNLGFYNHFKFAFGADLDIIGKRYGLTRRGLGYPFQTETDASLLPEQWQLKDPKSGKVFFDSHPVETDVVRYDVHAQKKGQAMVLIASYLREHNATVHARDWITQQSPGAWVQVRAVRRPEGAKEIETVVAQFTA